MKVCMRVLAGLVLLVATAGLLLSVAGGVGVWVVKGPVTDKATRGFGRIDSALDVAEQGLDHAQTSLARAAERLDGVKQDQRKLAQERRRNNPLGGVLGGFLARRVQERVAPELGDAHETLHTVAEAAVVVNSVLEDLGSFPFLSTTGVDLDRLTEMNNQLADVGPAAWELSRLLGEPESDPDAADAQLSRIERTLETVRGLVGQYQTQVTEVRQRTGDLRSKTLAWITPAAIIISLVCFWIAASQVGLLAHARSWWRRSASSSQPIEPASRS
jgi:hypothetical protein